MVQIRLYGGEGLKKCVICSMNFFARQHSIALCRFRLCLFVCLSLWSYTQRQNIYQAIDAVWYLTTNGAGRINEVTLRRARLVLRWVTVSFCSQPVSVCNQPPRPTQLPTLSGMENEYRPNDREALRLVGTVHSTCG